MDKKYQDLHIIYDEIGLHKGIRMITIENIWFTNKDTIEVTYHTKDYRGIEIIPICKGLKITID